MSGRLRWLPIGLLALGAALVAHSAISGATRVYLVLLVPVLSGASVEFGLGILLLFAGFLTFPFVVSADGSEDGRPPSNRSGAAPPSASGSGGVVILGPVPFFFGSWKGASRTAYWAAALVGTAVVVALVLFLLLF